MILHIIKGADIDAISASSHLSILENLRAAGYSEPDAPCGGNGTCKKCTVTVTGPVISVADGTPEHVTAKPLLACRYRPAGDLELLLPDTSAMRVVADSSVALSGGKSGLGAAFDIGTTTVAGFLYDLQTGAMLASTGARNRERAYGADVISRITACSEGKLPALSACIQEQLRDMQTSLAADAGRKTSEIKMLSIAGNTVMEHIFASMSPESIGIAPFTPLSLFGETYTEGPLFEVMDMGGLEAIYLSPCVAGYVGGDITAGLLATAADEVDGLRLFLDIGTNGEMALGNRDNYVCCATAAGPAFEGAEIICGMGGLPGAIDRVTLKNGIPEIHVIGDTAPIGICGSGLIDAIAVLLDLEIITETGRLVSPDEAPESVRDRIFEAQDGRRAFRLAGDVSIHAQDIREVQLAKAAIRAGAETLLALQNTDASKITELVIAGGFGSFMDKNSALRIGLLPKVAPDRIRHAGNAAGTGACIALEDSGREHLAAMCSKCTYLELSSSAEFMENYVEYMAFDE